MLETCYHINGAQPERHYREQLSDYYRREQLSHAREWLLFPQNTGSRLSIDETSLGDGELYTVVTGKAAKGGKGAVAAVVAGTAPEQVIEVPERLPEELLDAVEEVIPDMADSIRKTVRRCFPKALRVIDRFHVRKSAHGALQEMRITRRRDAISQETEAGEQAKLADEKQIPQQLENGDSRRQLLAGSRYLLFKSSDKWTEKQKQRAKLLFELYPDIKKGYSLTHSLRMLFSKNTIKDAARVSLAG
jgi:transposase